MKKIKMGLVGCGTIGREIGKAIISEIQGTQLIAIVEPDKENLKIFNELFGTAYCSLSIDELISISDFVIESASSKISHEVAHKALGSGKDVMILSVGGLLDNFSELVKLADEKGGKLYIPSGAICGLDGLKAASCGEIFFVTLTTRKPPQSFSDAPYIIQHKIDVSNIIKETCVFEGSAKEAVSAFPKNINVALTLSLAGIGAEKTKVKIIADPASKKNVHEIYVKGDFGNFSIRTENEPSPGNPKTSFLAVLSAISMLKNITNSVKIGV